MARVTGTGRKRLGLPVLAVIALLAAASFATAGPITPTPYFGGYTARVDGATVVTGAIGVTGSGELYFGGPFSTVTPDGLATLRFNDISGWADPSITFSVGAQNLSDISRSFEFSFVLPIALSGTIDGHSYLSYFLDPYTTAGGEIAPTAATILTAFDSDTTAGGLGDLNKGLDLGHGLSVADAGYGGSGDLFAASRFTGSLAYDRMVVNLGFTLTPHSGASLGGTVEQRAEPNPVPEPGSTLYLLAGGLAGIAARKRKSRR